MSNPTHPSLLVVGVGGLGTAVVREAFERGLEVSVLVRDSVKLSARLGDANVARLKKITVGDALDPAAVDEAMEGVEVVVSGNGAHQRMARALAEGVKRNGVGKLIWPAGGSNLMSEDGVTPAYVAMMDRWPNAKDIYDAHQRCIDTIREVGVNHVIWAPGRMTSLGHRSPNVAETVRVNRPAGMYVSYEDAAWVVLEAATTDAYDGELVAASTEPPAP